MSINQAVLLLGGRGERLKPFTDTNPKPMIEICGKPFLEHLTILLKNNGLKRMLFLVGYLGEKISSYFKNGAKWGLAIDYSLEDAPMGTGGALKLAKNKLDNEFFLLFGDSYLPLDYTKMADFCSKTRKDITVAIYDNAKDTKVPFNVSIDPKKGTIISYNKKDASKHKFNYCDAGVAMVKKDVLDLINDNASTSFEEEIYPKLIAGEKLGYYKAKERFYDVGTIERVKDFENYIKGIRK